MNKEEKKTSQSMLPAEAVMAEAVPYSGTVKVHESVIASIVRKATCAVPGGTHIPEIAEAIQLAVIGEITKITGMQVNKVNVVIIDLEEEQDQSDAE